MDISTFSIRLPGHPNRRLGGEKSTLWPMGPQVCPSPANISSCQKEFILYCRRDERLSVAGKRRNLVLKENLKLDFESRTSDQQQIINHKRLLTLDLARLAIATRTKVAIAARVARSW